ncbi:uncharacterized protein LOC118647456 [Monomorium pharaonis]|uniref:uncharacterized protein LOC118647456 n=1 Tax=Monomorium pharaonis TaxID=307658 RepID=UPI00174752C8|nr:uncharacterized protein LOC118647456 [Monomorium pharaonis]
MTRFAIMLFGLASLAAAKPAFLSVPLTYATPLIPGTQVGGANGGASDAPESVATHIDGRTGMVNGATSSVPVGSRSLRERQSSAPLGADGRVVDTPEVAAAKAAHAAAHVNERISLANEVARSSGTLLASPDVVAAGEPADGKVPDAPEAAAARANERIDLASGAATAGDVDLARRVAYGRAVVPLVLGNGVVAAALVPVGPDGSPPSEVATRDEESPASDAVRSVDALAIAGPALAYGRLLY